MSAILAPPVAKDGELTNLGCKRHAEVGRWRCWYLQDNKQGECRYINQVSAYLRILLIGAQIIGPARHVSFHV